MNGNVFEGEFKCDQRVKGKCAFRNGDFYDGEYANDVMCGFGLLVYADGSEYEGYFKSNKIDLSRAGEKRPSIKGKAPSVRVSVQNTPRPSVTNGIATPRTSMQADNSSRRPSGANERTPSVRSMSIQSTPRQSFENGMNRSYSRGLSVKHLPTTETIFEEELNVESVGGLDSSSRSKHAKSTKHGETTGKKAAAEGVSPSHLIVSGQTVQEIESGKSKGCCTLS